MINVIRLDGMSMNKQRLNFFFIIFSTWIIFGLFLALDMYLFYPFPRQSFNLYNELSWELTLSLIWAFSTPIVIAISRRFPIERKTWIRRVSLHLIVSFTLSFFQCLAHGLIRIVILHPAFSENTSILRQSLFYNIDKMMMVYFIILFVDHGVSYSRKLKENEVRASKLEAQLMQAQLQALKMQLHPHFLFNTLNAVTTLLHKDPMAAERMIVRLGDLLRFTLEKAGTQLVPLQEEIQFLKSYLEIEQIRFHDRISIVFDVPLDTVDLQVPIFLLQPLVENAIKHGFAPSSAPGKIEIIARRENSALRLLVKDNGAGIRSKTGSGVREGVGISNTKAQLRQLYNSSFNFELINSENGGTTASISIPLRHAEKELSTGASSQ